MVATAATPTGKEVRAEMVAVRSSLRRRRASRLPPLEQLTLAEEVGAPAMPPLEQVEEAGPAE
jgi:hypothetical protein